MVPACDNAFLTDDQQCIASCLNGHPDEYAQLVRRYQAAVLSYLAGRLGDREWAEDASQETFVRAYFALGRLRKTESFFSWLLGIAARVVKEQLRHRERQQVLAQIASVAQDEPELSANYALEKSVARLPKPYRQVVLLRYYGGRSCAQIAHEYGLPLGTVTKRLSRAYAMLREKLGSADHLQLNNEEST